ncbi:MAG TPA: radical SAM protein [Chryseosolibacter sp.]|nr:radical SAM protein [Chryseosolibacter sp.]
MKILLSHGYFLEEDLKEKAIMRPYAPLGILYISAYLQENGFENEVFDTTFSQRKTLYEHLENTQPDVVGLYVNLMTKVNIVQIVAFIKEKLPNAIVILGGPDVRFNADSYLKHRADFIVMGEGEVTMLELVRKCRVRATDFHDVSGIAFKLNGEVKVTVEREKLKDIDQLPFPARNRIDFDPYLKAWRAAHGKNAMSISTMRGCPYTCKWCSRAVYGLSYRRRSPEKVATEIRYIQEKYNPDTLWFVDDVFTISHKWLKTFRDILSANNIVISYECISRADRMNEEVIQLLKETGCIRVWIGAESGSQKVIDLMERRVNVEQVRDMIKLTKAHGIEAGTFIMLGYPGETEEDIFETINHLKNSDPDHFTITVAYPIKGTELYEETESLHSKHLSWDESTDRQIDFQRTYPKKYYDYAVRHVISEVTFHRHKNKFQLVAAKHKIKSLLARAGMKVEKILNQPN